MRMLVRFLLLAALAAVSVPASAQPNVAANGMVASPEPFASDVGIAILKAGGNAFDAAAAVHFALAVTYPTAGNLGGGGFMVGLTAGGETFALDFREEAPAAATEDMFVDGDGQINYESATPKRAKQQIIISFTGFKAPSPPPRP